jgi:hypothetical protein
MNVIEYLLRRSKWIERYLAHIEPKTVRVHYVVGSNDFRDEDRDRAELEQLLKLA